MNHHDARHHPPIPLSKLLMPLAALMFASAVACSLLGARMVLTGSWRQVFLPWNLFLAWLPLLFAWLAVRAETSSCAGRWRFRGLALAWLLFFPNAPYILTDLWHLPPNWQGRFWTDLVLILLFALTGLVLGFLSLYLMQSLVARRFGWVHGWLLACGVAALSEFGVCIGRFLRWNSWDALVNPGGLLADLRWCALQMVQSPRLLALPILFATLLFVAYVLLYALARMPAASTETRLAAWKP